MAKLQAVCIVLWYLARLISAELFVVSNSAKASGNNALIYPNHKFKEAYCITDDLDSALVWNYHLDWQFPSFQNADESHKTYLLPRSQRFVYPASDSLNCWMNHTSECSRHWLKHGNWMFRSSMENPTAPVTDARWEDFDELRLNHLFRRVDVLPASGNLAVSIRGSANAHLAVCDGKTVSESFCFFVILGGWGNTRSVIRKCELGIAESTEVYPTGECARILAEHTGQVLSASEWRHFVLKWDFERQIFIGVYDRASLLLSYRTPRSSRDYFAGEGGLNGRRRYYLHARSSTQMLMKPHVFSYSLATLTQSKLTSPPIMSPNKQHLCVELSVSLCEKCMMTVDYVDSRGTTRAGKVIRNEASTRNAFDLPVWQSVKINKTLATVNQTMVQPVKIVINTLLTDGEAAGPYWAVSNVRRCNDEVLKITRIKSFQDSTVNEYFWPNVTCQRMSANGETLVIEAHDAMPTTKTALPLCTEGTIGPSCSANCSSLFWEHPDCQQLLSCDNNGCSCAPGFTMPTCDNRCPASTYGYECEMRCGNCAQDLCKASTGECSYGCANTDKYYFLPPYCKYGIGPPPAPIVDIVQFTGVKVSLKVLPDYKVIPTNVTFEIWLDSGTRIFESDVIPVNNSTSNVESDVENLRPGTHYRVIGVVHAAKRTFRGLWTNFTTLCTESVALNFHTSSDESSIIVDNQVVVNDSCPDTWYRVELLNGKRKIFDNSSTFPVAISGLEPYTTYRVVVRSENSSVIVDRDVTTLEGAPERVKNVYSASSHPNNVTVTWTPPDEPRGKIVNYTLEIEPISSVGCSDHNLTSYNATMSKKLRQRVAVAGSNKNTLKYEFNDLRPYTDYLVTIYAYTSRHQGATTWLKCTTMATEMPTEIVTDVHLTNERDSSRVAGFLRWSVPPDCSSIQGPTRAFRLYYRKLGDKDYEVIEALNYNYYPLEKNSFDGAETYEGRLHLLRDMGGLENKTAFAGFKINLPAREPPPVRNLEIVEVDVDSESLTLRWEPPQPPIHGQLESYSIACCNTESKCDEGRSVSVKSDEFCDLWSSDIGLKMHKENFCRSIPLPKDRDCSIIQVEAHNKNVTVPSQAEFLQVVTDESMPSEPSGMTTEIIDPQNALVKVSWAHPWKSGGRLKQFSIFVHVIESSLKRPPWNSKSEDFKIDAYKPQYDLALNLFPSTTFGISVTAVTANNFIGKTRRSGVAIPTFVNVSALDLWPEVSHDLTIPIRIPEVANDVVNSTMIIVVQGPRYCDEGPSNNEDVDAYLDSEESSYYKVAWKAATITEPEAAANKRFEIGDGLTYGGSKNYVLCPTESYIINLIIANGTNVLQARSNANSPGNILKRVKTGAIKIGEKPQNLAMWLVPTLFVILIAVLLLFVLHRKRIAKHFYDKSKVCQQENMPLSNDFGKKKSVDEADALSIVKETKDLPNNLLVNDESKPEFVMPIKLDDFERYFESVCKSGALQKEYSTIQRGATKPCTYGSQAETKPKNRYANLYPYDESRVALEKLPDDPHSDYINANFIKGYGDDRGKAYIATQGPKPHTVIDFWRMIWQEKVQIICMMANLVENGKVKCEQYWPSAVGKRILYGSVSVQFAGEEVHLDYTYRTFRVTRDDEETRTVEHLHYTSWPDHGVPSNPGSIVSFLKEIHRHAPVPREPDDPPIVVHCSAGVGRTGTLVVLDMSLCRAFAERAIDVYADVLSVREQRMNMVDNTEQYLLVHLVLVEYFNSESTCFSCDKTLPERIAKAKLHADEQYRRILDTSWWGEVLGSPPLPEKSLSNANRAKHRFPESAGNINRLYLKRSVINDEDSDYIAATNVRGVFRDRNYVTTQLPLPATSADFWRMLAEHNVELVLVLQRPDLNDPSYCELVPESQGFGSTKYLKVMLQKGNTTSAECYSTEEALIIDSSEQPIKDQTVTIITYKNWPETSLPPASDVVKLWQRLEKQPKQQKCPIVIVCRDGVTACGLWLASSFLLNRMTIDRECDVSQAVRAIRRCRKNFLDKPENLGYLYDVALAWSREN